jgi:hypothetical protein
MRPFQSLVSGRRDPLERNRARMIQCPKADNLIGLLERTSPSHKCGPKPERLQIYSNWRRLFRTTGRSFSRQSGVGVGEGVGKLPSCSGRRALSQAKSVARPARPYFPRILDGHPGITGTPVEFRPGRPSYASRISAGPAELRFGCATQSSTATNLPDAPLMASRRPGSIGPREPGIRRASA